VREKARKRSGGVEDWERGTGKTGGEQGVCRSLGLGVDGSRERGGAAAGAAVISRVESSTGWAEIEHGGGKDSDGTKQQQNSDSRLEGSDGDCEIDLGSLALSAASKGSDWNWLGNWVAHGRCARSRRRERS
jgi:hypothetical protein